MSVVIDGTTGISGNDGSAATPALRGDDANTGVFFPAADTVAVATAGAEAMRIASSGYVGIGTTNPNYNLHINSAFGSAQVQFTYSASGSGVSDGFFVGSGTAGGFIREAENLPITFSTNNTQCFALASSGAIGVGPALSYGTSGHLLTSSGSGAAPSWASVGTATAGLAYGDVGTYAYLNINTTANLSEGSTFAGSSLSPAGSYVVNSMVAGTGQTSGAIRGAATLSGTWRLMGSNNIGATAVGKQNVFLRIS